MTANVLQIGDVADFEKRNFKQLNKFDMENKTSSTNETAAFGNTILPAVFCQQEEVLIANYMDEKATGGYHQSWNWLMPVVVKINANGFYFFWEDYVVKFCRWSDGSGSISKESFLKSEDAFKAVYKCVVDFLKECYPVEQNGR